VLTLVQDVQKLAGVLGAQPVSGRVRGERIELQLSAGPWVLRGVVRGDAIEGEAVTAGGATQRWMAYRVN
jgi:hypothetical protein